MLWLYNTIFYFIIIFIKFCVDLIYRFHVIFVIIILFSLQKLCKTYNFYIYYNYL